MEPFRKIKSIVTPFDKVNVDTDQIVPKQFLKLIHKTGFGKFLFYNWRFDNNGNQIPSFILNDPKYKNSKILITRDNFGCGSSREHAVWALKDYGFFVIIAPSFADIFYSNCFKNGLLPIILDSKTVDSLFQTSSEIEVDLEAQKITTPTKTISFEIDGHRKQILLKGLDDIAMTLEYEDEISDYEKQATIPSLL
ncbi:MAG: 3-isopropylmalate dehydratase small subunit [Thermoproteota archaeon]|jgi:3-isopropylmalate/(R)-2-methylmalate dehydratase small subunit|nr:3-isopropylmalate dehydratase small subunit [Nitrosopumilaceae archaeon]